MDLPTESLVDARSNMVDGQLRPNKVNDRSLLAAMRDLPREHFLPAGVRSLAYADTEVPAAADRFTFSPMVLARLIQALELRPAAAVLVLGAGYAAAVLARCGATVTAVEDDAQAVDRSQTIYARTGLAVRIVAGPLPAGHPAGAPYDVIFIDGAVRRLPALTEQLATHPPGRLAAVLLGQGRSGSAVIAETVAGTLVPRSLFDCAATGTPAFDPAPSFSF